MRQIDKRETSEFLSLSMCICAPVCLCLRACVCVCMGVCVFVRVFGPCHNVGAKGLEQHRNLLPSPVPKRERDSGKGGRQKEGKREKRERVGKT